MKGIVVAIVGVLFVIANVVAARASFTFDDIQYWVGTGSNRAAIAIDWSDGSTTPPALVWGYRWNGTATGRDMLTAVVKADDRLFAKFGGSSGSEATLYGLGYDANNDGQFAIDDDTSFDPMGIAYTGPADLAMSVDPADYYAEGWFTGFWHYGVASSDPFGQGSWLNSQTGMASRMLADGAWDSWTFSPTFSFAAFAQNPQAAAPPPALLPGDFNADGRVNIDDYVVWKNVFGSTTQLAADGNHNGIVDAADYTVWRDHLGIVMGQSATTSFSAAEPSSALLTLCSLCSLWLFSIFPRKERVR
jgi:dockerin type I repeat protein